MRYDHHGTHRLSGFLCDAVQGLWRVAESRASLGDDELVAKCPLAESDDVSSVNVRALNPARLAYKGWLQRELRETKQNLGFRLLENDCEVEG